MNEPPSLYMLSQAVTLNSLWGVYRQSSEISLAKHCRNVEQEITRLSLPEQILVDLKESLCVLEQAYNDAYCWLSCYRKRIETLKYNKLDIYSGKYCLSNFMTLQGKFNDENWVIQFVNDETLDRLDRFYFASFYCWKEKSHLLLYEVRQNNRNNKCLLDIFSSCGKYSLYWLNYVLGEENFDVYFDCWSHAVLEGHIEAVCFFWDKISEDDLMDFYHNDLGTSLNIAASNGYLKCVHFIFSSLNPSLQLTYLQENFEILPSITIWHYYLQPQLVKFLPDQIELHQASLPETAYAEILYQLALKMKKINRPLYELIFCKVWKIGSPENKSYFLQNDQKTLLMLLTARNFVFANIILKECSLEQKKYFLFETAEELLCRNPSFRSDPSAIRRYLDLFTMDLMSTGVKQVPFHSNSLTFMNEIKEKISKKSFVVKKNKKRRRYTCEISLSIIENLISEITNFF